MIVTFTDAPGFPPNPQAVGQFRLVVKDVLLTSEGANDAGDFVLDPEDIGMKAVLGVLDLHVYLTGTAVATADKPRIIDYVPATGVLTFMATDRGALDLDSTDTSQARLAFLGY